MKSLGTTFFELNICTCFTSLYFHTLPPPWRLPCSCFLFLRSLTGQWVLVIWGGGRRWRRQGLYGSTTWGWSFWIRLVFVLWCWCPARYRLQSSVQRRKRAMPFQLMQHRAASQPSGGGERLLGDWPVANRTGILSWCHCDWEQINITLVWLGYTDTTAFAAASLGLFFTLIHTHTGF